MRTRGWRGRPPRTDDEARARIIEATTRCVERFGPHKTGLTDVAEELGVTRATVYRYFGTIEELFKATSLAAVDEFLGRLTVHVAPCATRPEGGWGHGILPTPRRIRERFRTHPP